MANTAAVPAEDREVIRLDTCLEGVAFRSLVTRPAAATAASTRSLRAFFNASLSLLDEIPAVSPHRR
jgi:hypothetical protein